MNLFYRRKNKNKENGQILPLFAVLVPVIILFVGFAIDLGFAYVSKASLSKAVDSACLMGMRNLYRGQGQAATIARSTFAMNYGSSGRDNGPPVVNLAFSTDAGNNILLTVDATATINTFFIRILPRWKTIDVAAHAQATRAKLIMSLVLDRSSSMNVNGGAQALPPAVSNFVDLFDDNNDRVAMISFSTIPRVDVPIQTQFQTPIKNAVTALTFHGATFSQAGLLNAQTQNNSVAVAPGENVVKVVVFFTDGWANMNQDILNCPAPTLINYGGCAPPEDAAGQCNRFAFFDPKTGSGRRCGAKSFPSQLTGTMEPLTPISTGETNISNDAMYRAVQVANAVRAEAVPTVVYSIGLGNMINTNFLYQIANDPASPTFNPNQPVGKAVFAPDCPSAVCSSELNQVFQTIASSIVLRLTQ